MSDTLPPPGSPPGPPLGPPTGPPAQPPGPPGPQGEPDPAPKPWWQRWWAIAAAVAVVLVVVVGIVSSGDDDSEDESATTDSIVDTAPDTEAPESTEAPVETEVADTEPPSTEAATTTEAPTTTEVPETTEVPATTEAPPTTSAPTTTEAPATTAAPTTTTGAPAPAEPTCGYLGVDDFDDMQVELAFVNPLGDIDSLSVTYALVDSAGVRFFTDEAFIDHVRADEPFRIEEDTLTSLPAGVDDSGATCQILDIGEGFSTGGLVAAPDSTCTVDEIDSFGDIQITVGLTSPFDQVESLWVHYALTSRDGIRFDSDFATIDLVGPGEQVRTSEDTLTSVPTWLDQVDLACTILGVEIQPF